MPEYVRVKQPETGHETTIERSAYDRNPDAWALTEKPAVDSAGRVIPPKYAVPATARKRSAKASDAAPDTGQQATTENKEGA